MKTVIGTVNATPRSGAYNQLWEQLPARLWDKIVGAVAAPGRTLSIRVRALVDRQVRG